MAETGLRLDWVFRGGCWRASLGDYHLGAGHEFDDAGQTVYGWNAWVVGQESFAGGNGLATLEAARLAAEAALSERLEVYVTPVTSCDAVAAPAPVTDGERCGWCNQKPHRGMPQPPVRVHIRLDGATDDDVARLLPTLPGWLAAVQVDPLPERFTTDGSRSISVVRRDVTMERYRAEADAWMGRVRSASRASQALPDQDQGASDGD